MSAPRAGQLGCELTLPTIKAPGFVFGVDIGSTSRDMIAWSLGIRTREGDLIILMQTVTTILARSIGVVIVNKVRPRINPLNRFRIARPFGK